MTPFHFDTSINISEAVGVVGALFGGVFYAGKISSKLSNLDKIADSLTQLTIEVSKIKGHLGLD